MAQVISPLLRRLLPPSSPSRHLNYKLAACGLVLTIERYVIDARYGLLVLGACRDQSFIAALIDTSGELLLKFDVFIRSV